MTGIARCRNVVILCEGKGVAGDEMRATQTRREGLATHASPVDANRSEAAASVQDSRREEQRTALHSLAQSAQDMGAPRRAA